MYIIEGTIGAGKSTFLKMVEQSLPMLSVTLEPFHNWQQQVYGQSLLANFYQDPNRWAYTFELLTMMCRVKDHLHNQASSTSLKLVERSLYSGYYCFSKNSYENGYMSETEWHLYTTWFNFLVTGKCNAPKGFIYLKVNPTVAYERIKKRNRHAEKNITLNYLKQLEKRHEDFLINRQNVLPELQSVPVLILDCNQEFEENSEQYNNHVQQVEAFIQQTF